MDDEISQEKFENDLQKRSYDHPPYEENNASGKRGGMPFALSLIVNILLIVILLGPWLWAYFGAPHPEGPKQFIVNTWDGIKDLYHNAVHDTTTTFREIEK